MPTYQSPWICNTWAGISRKSKRIIFGISLGRLENISNIFHNPKQLLDIIIRYATRCGSVLYRTRRETLEFVRSYYIERCSELSCEKYETALSSFCKALRSADRAWLHFGCQLGFSLDQSVY